MYPKISIVTVCYNSEKTIRDTIESVLLQKYQNIEHIVVDGASTDGTMDIVNEYEGRIAKIISEPDAGIYDAMNKGIQMATGNFVGILNSDDVFADNYTIAKLVNFFSLYPEIEGAYGDLIYVQRTNPEITTRYFSSEKFSPWTIRFGLIFPHPTLYVKPEIFKKIGFYKLDYRVSADFEMMARMIKKGVVLGRNPQVMVKMREGGVSSTGFWWRIHQNFEIVRACKENGIYTNILLIMLKIPFKLATYLKKKY